MALAGSRTRLGVGTTVSRAQAMTRAITEASATSATGTMPAASCTATTTATFTGVGGTHQQIGIGQQHRRQQHQGTDRSKHTSFYAQHDRILLCSSD
jgi:hypothetical protein